MGSNAIYSRLSSVRPLRSGQDLNAQVAQLLSQTMNSKSPESRFLLKPDVVC